MNKMLIIVFLFFLAAIAGAQEAPGTYQTSVPFVDRLLTPEEQEVAIAKIEADAAAEYEKLTPLQKKAHDHPLDLTPAEAVAIDAEVEAKWREYAKQPGAWQSYGYFVAVSPAPKGYKGSGFWTDKIETNIYNGNLRLNDLCSNKTYVLSADAKITVAITQPITDDLCGDIE